MKNILYFAQIHSLFPSIYANNYQVMRMCEGLSEEGYKVNLIVPYGNVNKHNYKKVKGNIWEFYHVKRKFKINRCNIHYSYKNRFAQLIYGLNVVRYTLKNQLKGIVYTRSGWIALFLLLLKYKVIYEAHNYNTDLPIKIIKLLINYNNNFIGFICITKALAVDYINFGIKKSKVIVAHDAVNINSFKGTYDKNSLRAELDLPLNKKIICFSGHLYKDRGFEIILKAAKRLNNNIFIILGGHKNDIIRCKKLILAKNIKNIWFYGHLNQGVMIKYLKASDVLLLIYNKDLATKKYMSPLKLFEYMASNKPIIASDFPVLREILIDKYNSVLIEPENPNKLIESIDKITNDIQFSKFIANNALVDVSSKTWNNRAKYIFTKIKLK